MSPSPCFVFAVLVVIGCSRAAPPTDASAPAIDRALAPVVAPTVDVPPALDVAPDVALDVARSDARVDTARARPSHAGAPCDDRVGCGNHLVCCTHGGIPMPRTHHGTCLSFRGCNTLPAARGAR